MLELKNTQRPHSELDSFAQSTSRSIIGTPIYNRRQMTTSDKISKTEQAIHETPVEEKAHMVQLLDLASNYPALQNRISDLQEARSFSDISFLVDSIIIKSKTTDVHERMAICDIISKIDNKRYFARNTILHLAKKMQKKVEMEAIVSLIKNQYSEMSYTCEIVEAVVGSVTDIDQRSALIDVIRNLKKAGAEGLRKFALTSVDANEREILSVSAVDLYRMSLKPPIFKADPSDSVIDKSIRFTAIKILETLAGKVDSENEINRLKNCAANFPDYDTEQIYSILFSKCDENTSGFLKEDISGRIRQSNEAARVYARLKTTEVNEATFPEPTPEEPFPTAFEALGKNFREGSSIFDDIFPTSGITERYKKSNFKMMSVELSDLRLLEFRDLYSAIDNDRSISLNRSDEIYKKCNTKADFLKERSLDGSWFEDAIVVGLKKMSIKSSNEGWRSFRMSLVSGGSGLSLGLATSYAIVFAKQPEIKAIEFVRKGFGEFIGFGTASGLIGVSFRQAYSAIERWQASHALLDVSEISRAGSARNAKFINDRKKDKITDEEQALQARF